MLVIFYNAFALPKVAEIAVYFCFYDSCKILHSFSG